MTSGNKSTTDRPGNMVDVQAPALPSLSAAALEVLSAIDCALCALDIATGDLFWANQRTLALTTTSNILALAAIWDAQEPALVEIRKAGWQAAVLGRTVSTIPLCISTSQGMVRVQANATAFHLVGRGTAAIIELSLLGNEPGYDRLPDRKILKLAEGAYRNIAEIADHQLRSPLAALSAVSGRLQSSPSTLTPEALREAGERIKRIADRISGIAEGWLKQPLAEGDAAKTLFSEMNLGALVLDIADLLRMTHPNQRIATSVAEDVTVFGDPDLVAQAVDCIVSNSLKYGATTVMITLERFDQTGEVAIVVSDNGATPLDSQPAKLFDKGTRGMSGRLAAGRGLGLWIARFVAEQHGGRVEFLTSETATTDIGLFFPTETAGRDILSL